jgi:hypothetical protein
MIVSEALGGARRRFSALYSRMGGFDEMDQVPGDGSAELRDDGSIEIEFAYRQR